MDFNFLSNVIIEEAAPKVRTSKTDKNPTNGAHLRIFRDGSIYPSVEFSAIHGLDYGNKDNGNPEYGFDLVPSNHWGAYPQDLPNVLFLGRVSKSENKVDLFGSTKYNEDGTPKNTVLEQGSTSAGKRFLELYCETYGTTEEELFGENTHVDFLCGEAVNLSPNGIYNFPKQISRGPEKGNWTYVTRNHPVVMPIGVYTEEGADSYGETPVSEDSSENHSTGGYAGFNQLTSSNSNEVNLGL